MEHLHEVKDTNTTPERLHALVVVGVEPGVYLVYLEKAGANKISAIKAIRATSWLSLAESKQLVDSAPTYLPVTFSSERANEAKASLLGVGAVADIVEAPKLDSVLARYAAYNPSASASLLRLLSLSSELDVQRAVVENPSTPLALLYQLGASYPRAFLRNPLLPLLLLENPTFPASFPLSLVEALAEVEDLPMFMIDAFVHLDDLYQEKISAHPKLTQEHLRELAKSNANYVLCGAFLMFVLLVSWE